MSFWSAIVAIVAIIAFMSIRIAKYRAISSAPQADPAPDAGLREREMERELASLRQRLAVLERITTDANSLDHRQTTAIAAEIESLRDR